MVNSNLTDEDIKNWFGKSATKKDDYIDNRISLVPNVVALLKFWREISNIFEHNKTGYHLAEKWGDEALMKKYIEDSKPILKKLIIIEEELRQELPKLKNVKFLQDDELTLLPIWMLELMEVKID